MQMEKLKDLIGILQAYHGDLVYWKDCGPEHWVSCTCSTPAPDLQTQDGRQYDIDPQEAEVFMEDYVGDVQEMLSYFQRLVEKRA